MYPINSFCGVFLFFCVLILSTVIRRRRERRLANPKNLPYPPGPKPLPILGNLFDLARDNEAATYYQLAEQFGDLFFLSVFGQNVLVVNSFQTANELFEKRSANYSDRGRSTMVHELMGWEWSFAHMRYGENWRAHRKIFHQQFQQSVAPTYWPLQIKEAHSLLRRLLRAPQDLTVHMRHTASSIVMSVIYGISIAPQNDPYVNMSEKALDGMTKAANPGAFLVDLVPLLLIYYSAWFPGAGFQRKAYEWKKACLEMRDAPFDYVHRALKSGRASSCFVTNAISNLDTKEPQPKSLDIIRQCAGVAYAAGAESTMSTLTTFILAIVTNPEVQVKAQKELDRVIGHRRLPEFSDRPSLPYINAIVKEVLRWNPVAPLGLPHMVTNDDEYKGYFIPAGTIVVGNSWRILHDPLLYQEPHKFNPDRFLNTAEGLQFSPVDPLSVSFGYGRRVCPGRYMAEAQVWISIACMLSVFDITPGTDINGEKMTFEPAFSSGMICHPLPFPYRIQARGEFATALIDQTEDIAA
ncbi:cytochrome P450 [Crucibulum laeve]|uniref:Cytochrome P450 n=1 Tax=Crucibulum laeve TaxID=68775 RepID=A0A5C3LQY7_9AGAR|nr:cytochrome P450 [Crucibulum laeve]